MLPAPSFHTDIIIVTPPIPYFGLLCLQVIYPAKDAEQARVDFYIPIYQHVDEMGNSVQRQSEPYPSLYKFKCVANETCSSPLCLHIPFQSTYSSQHTFSAAKS